MRVVDTNIVAYLLLEGDNTSASRALMERDADWHSEPFLLVEMANVLLKAVRFQGLTRGKAVEVMDLAEAVFDQRLHPAAHSDVLDLAYQLNVSAYDARFLVAARSLGARLVTEDVKLRKAAPELTQSLAEALAAT